VAGPRRRDAEVGAAVRDERTDDLRVRGDELDRDIAALVPRSEHPGDERTVKAAGGMLDEDAFVAKAATSRRARARRSPPT
jgi:hypothetical protein